MIERGLKLTVLCREDRLLNRVAPEHAALAYQTTFAERGVDIRFGAEVTDVSTKAADVDPANAPSSQSEEDQGHIVRLKSGDEIEADLVIAGVGARPAGSLFTDKLDMNQSGHIVVSDNLETSNPGVFAAGDVAAFPSSYADDQLLTLENVNHARASARYAVQTMLGKEQPPYNPIPHMYSRFLGFSWQMHGKMSGGTELRFAKTPTAQTKNTDTELLGAMWLDEAGRVQGTFMESAEPAEHESLVRLIAAKASKDEAHECIRSLGVDFCS